MKTKHGIDLLYHGQQNKTIGILHQLERKYCNFNTNHERSTTNKMIRCHRARGGEQRSDREMQQRGLHEGSVLGCHHSCYNRTLATRVFFFFFFLFVTTSLAVDGASVSQQTVVEEMFDNHIRSDRPPIHHNRLQQTQDLDPTTMPSMSPSSTTTTTFEYHLEPKLRWATEFSPMSPTDEAEPSSTTISTNAAVSTSLFSSSSSTPTIVFGKGNAIRQSPFNSNLLYATTAQGSLVVVSATNGTVLRAIHPRPRVLTEDGETSVWNLTSTSGISFGRQHIQQQQNEQDQGQGRDRRFQKFLIYSVIDVPPSTSRFLPKSRVLAVSIPQHTIMWTSAGLAGTTPGTPVIYSYGYHVQSSPSQEQGPKTTNWTSAILITHNSAVVRSTDNATVVTGHVSLLDATTGRMRWTESDTTRFSSSSSSSSSNNAYGPPAIYHCPEFGGNFINGQHNTNDIVVWTTMASLTVEDVPMSTANGTVSTNAIGHLNVFQMPMSASIVEGESASHNDLPGDDNVETPLSVQHMLAVDWTALSRPSIGRNGTSLFVGATKHHVHGWVGQVQPQLQSVNDASIDVDVDSTSSQQTTNTTGMTHRRWDQSPDWTTRLALLPTENPADAYVPISTSPVLSLDNQRLFVTSSAASNNETVALDTTTGEHLWAIFLGKSTMMSEARIAPDDERVYVALANEDGRSQLMAIKQRTGAILWKAAATCMNGNGVCQDFSADSSSSIPLDGQILADFDVSSDGSQIFFVDAGGKIVSVEVGHVLPASESSSSNATTNDTQSNLESSYPTTAPIGQGSVDDPKTSNMAQDQNSTDRPPRRGIVLGIVLPLVAFIVGVLFMMRLRGRRFEARRNFTNGKVQGVDLPTDSKVTVEAFDDDRYHDHKSNFHDDGAGDMASLAMGDIRGTIMVDVGMMYDPEPFTGGSRDADMLSSGQGLSSLNAQNGVNTSRSRSAEDFAYGSSIVV